MTDQSWGLFPKALDQKTIFPTSLGTNPFLGDSLYLPRGLGRSYGDSCLNDRHTLISTKQIDSFIQFDQATGRLRAESGVSLDRILRMSVPRGWFLPVTPGTKFVTLGGAIANDVHGKNHHMDGTIGHFIEQFELVRSSGERMICSRSQNQDFFRATIGGLGLTGFITWAELRLAPITSSWIDQEQIRFDSLDEFLALSKESQNFKYTVSWVDCLGSEDRLRGIFIRGDHRTDKVLESHATDSKLNIPVFFPEIALNSFSVKAFNELYYHKNYKKIIQGKVHYEPFFYPLDAILNWNKIYGRRGFLQYQFAVPFESGNSPGLRSLISEIKRSNLGSFLAVLKTFGAKENEGLLSFPQEGVTLALDFPNTGADLMKTLERCDHIVAELGGRVYAAKDARMSKASFAKFYPRLEEFKKYTDPQISSTFWRRVT